MAATRKLLRALNKNRRTRTCRGSSSRSWDFAEFERAITEKQVKSGIVVANAKEKILGRPARIFDRETAATLRSQGSSWCHRHPRFELGAIFKVTVEGSTTAIGMDIS